MRASRELRTERLVLRPVAEDDLGTLLALRNEPRVLAGTATGAELPRERMARQLDDWLASWRERELGAWLILRAGGPIGFVDVCELGEGRGVDPGEIELGVVIHPDHWGEALAGEAGLAVAEDLFTRVGLPRVYATADPGNAASLRAIAKVPSARLVSAAEGEELYELAAPRS